MTGLPKLLDEPLDRFDAAARLARPGRWSSIRTDEIADGPHRPDQAALIG
jgi:hypothetical protein